MSIHILWITDHFASSAIPHTHNFFQLAFCKKSGGTVTAGHTVYEAAEHYMYLFKPDRLHGIDAGNGMKLIEIKFIVNSNELLTAFELLPNIFELTAREENIILQISEKALQGTLNTSFSIDGALMLLFSSVLRRFGFIPQNEAHSAKEGRVFLGNPDFENSNTDIAILALKEYITTHITDDITLDILADTVHFNKTYFVKRFKIIWGTSPIKFVNGIRLEKAVELLVDTQLSISVIAEQTGFKSLHYFSRIFKMQKGLSPLEYRKKYHIE